MSEPLGPEDPTPDPDKGPLEERKGTTFLDVAAAAKAAGERIDTSDGLDADEVLDAAEDAAKAAGVPLSHHAISELRKLLVPIVTALIAAAAGGGFGAWKADQAQTQAVQQAEQKIQQAEQRMRELDELKRQVRRLVVERASWDGVDSVMRLKVDTEALVKDVSPIQSSIGLKLDDRELQQLVAGQIQQLETEAMTPRAILVGEAGTAEPAHAAPR